MDLEEFYFLITPEAQDLLEKAEGKDPLKWVMSLKGKGLPSAALASQLKYREKAKEKVPAWEQAGCLFEQRAFEQSTSEQLALAKPWGKGSRALDLTCGMGVDAWAMAKHFDEVIALEPDRLRFVLARHNFDSLANENITVWMSDAATWLDEQGEEKFDLIYLDPDRRDSEGTRFFRLEDCSPDIVSIQEELLHMGRRVLLKTSPMLDIDAALRQLSHVGKVTVLALDGECKELLFEMCLSSANDEATKRGVIFFRNGQKHEWECSPKEVSVSPEIIPQPKYIHEADISLYKAQAAQDWFEDQFPGKGRMVHPEGYFFTGEALREFPGRAYEVIAAMPWKPADVKRYLKEKGLSRVNLTRRHFDIPFDQIRSQLSIKEGGSDYLVFTRIWDGHEWSRMCYHCKRI